MFWQKRIEVVHSPFGAVSDSSSLSLPLSSLSLSLSLSPSLSPSSFVGWSRRRHFTMLIRAATEEREREPSFAFDTATAYTGDMSKFQRLPRIMLQRSALFHNPKQSLNTNIFAFYQPSSVNHFSLVPIVGCMASSTTRRGRLFYPAGVYSHVKR